LGRDRHLPPQHLADAFDKPIAKPAIRDHLLHRRKPPPSASSHRPTSRSWSLAPTPRPAATYRTGCTPSSSIGSRAATASTTHRPAASTGRCSPPRGYRSTAGRPYGCRTWATATAAEAAPTARPSGQSDMACVSRSPSYSNPLTSLKTPCEAQPVHWPTCRWSARGYHPPRDESKGRAAGLVEFTDGAETATQTGVGIRPGL
jgi:hypothetical protein